MGHEVAVRGRMHGTPITCGRLDRADHPMLWVLWCVVHVRTQQRSRRCLACVPIPLPLNPETHSRCVSYREQDRTHVCEELRAGGAVTRPQPAQQYNAHNRCC